MGHHHLDEGEAQQHRELLLERADELDGLEQLDDAQRLDDAEQPDVGAMRRAG